MKRIFILIFIVCSFCSCGTNHPEVPSSSDAVDSLPVIFPDYIGVTIPQQIAPLNFMIDDAESCVARFTATDGTQYTYGEGNKILIDENEWNTLLSKAKGSKIEVEVWAKSEGKWIKYQPFDIFVSDDPIDQYVSYRQIPPGYIGYEEIKITQRNLYSWEESDIYNNQKVSRGDNGQCANCHSYQNYNPNNMILHLRGYEGGTVVVYNGTTKKVDLKRPYTIGAGVYPAWHPTLPLIVFSNNKTKQAFHTASANRIEVFDTESDLILYDVINDSVKVIAQDENEWETFPTWSPDGKYLYFCSAHFEYQHPDKSPEIEVRSRYKEVKYNLYRLAFNKDDNSFGPRELVYDAAELGKSVTLPRVSPDESYILMAEGEFGCFNVWHRDADIKLLSMQSEIAENNENTENISNAVSSNIDTETTDTVKTVTINTEALNSGLSESYPTWSSNGRWIMIASRRDDGTYTRPYIAHFDDNGQIEKPFEIPVKDPEWYRLNLNSYNRPEFMSGKAKAIN